jgi:hypothetical protein
MSGRTPNQAYLDLQKLARAQGRNTQQLFELYIHERFNPRIAAATGRTFSSDFAAAQPYRP